MGQLSHFSAFAVGLILIFVGISIIASGEVFRALREIALNTRKAVASEGQPGKQTNYTALEFFATLHGIIGTLTMLVACIFIYTAIPERAPQPPSYSASSSAPQAKSSKVDPEKVQRARTEVGLLSAGLRQFRMDAGRYPTTQEGLQALWECPGRLAGCKGPYLPEAIPSDPWGHPYAYIVNTVTDSYRVLSYGADGTPGGQEGNADIEE